MELKPTAPGPQGKLSVLSKQPIHLLEAKPSSQLLHTFTTSLTSVFFSRYFKTKSSVCSYFQSLNLPEAYYMFMTTISLHIPLLFSSAFSLLLTSCFLFSIPLLCSLLVFLTHALTGLEEEGGEEGKNRERRGKAW